MLLVYQVLIYVFVEIHVIYLQHYICTGTSTQRSSLLTLSPIILLHVAFHMDFQYIYHLPASCGATGTTAFICKDIALTCHYTFDTAQRTAQSAVHHTGPCDVPLNHV